MILCVSQQYKENLMEGYFKSISVKDFESKLIYLQSEA